MVPKVGVSDFQTESPILADDRDGDGIPVSPAATLKELLDESSEKVKEWVNERRASMAEAEYYYKRFAEVRLCIMCFSFTFLAHSLAILAAINILKGDSSFWIVGLISLVLSALSFMVVAVYLVLTTQKGCYYRMKWQRREYVTDTLKGRLDKVMNARSLLTEVNAGKLHSRCLIRKNLIEVAEMLRSSETDEWR